MPSERLERLAAELIAVAEQMRQQRPDDEQADTWRAPEMAFDAVAFDAELHAPERRDTLARWSGLATQLYRFRRRRDRLFGAIFGEPAWDLMLDLFIMESRGKRVPVSSACIASGASHSTALRQIEELVRHKLVLRERDDTDKRRTYLKLTDEGLRKMALAMEQLNAEPQVRMADVLAHPAMLRGAAR